MQKVLHETCQQYVARRLSGGWKITSQKGFLVTLESPEGILRLVDLRNDVETLRPNAAGDETNVSNRVPDTGEANWEDVDEAVADDDTTYIWSYQDQQRDLYNLPASSGSGTINFIKIYFRVKGIRYANPCLKSNSTVTVGTQIDVTDSWVTYSEQWNTNPADSAAWQWADIDALQIGIYLDAGAIARFSYCTQVYVEVDYTPPGWTGKISGVTNPAKIMGVAVANIAKVKGVA